MRPPFTPNIDHQIFDVKLASHSYIKRNIHDELAKQINFSKFLQNVICEIGLRAKQWNEVCFVDIGVGSRLKTGELKLPLTTRIVYGSEIPASATLQLIACENPGIKVLAGRAKIQINTWIGRYSDALAAAGYHPTNEYKTALNADLISKYDSSIVQDATGDFRSLTEIEENCFKQSHRFTRASTPPWELAVFACCGATATGPVYTRHIHVKRYRASQQPDLGLNGLKDAIHDFATHDDLWDHEIKIRILSGNALLSEQICRWLKSQHAATGIIHYDDNQRQPRLVYIQALLGQDEEIILDLSTYPDISVTSFTNRL